MGQFDDFLLQRALRTNPSFAKNYYMQQNQQADQERLNGLLGAAGTPEQKYATEGPTEGPMMPGQERQAMPFNQVTQEAVQGTGLLGGQTSPQELGIRMMTGNLPNTRATGSNLLMQAMQPQKQGDFSFQQYQSMGPEERKTYDRYKGRGFTQPQAQPSSVKEWQYFNQLSPQEQQQYMQMKRQTQYLNTGSAFVNPPVMGTSQPSIPIKPKVTETPGYMAEQEKAKGQVRSQLKAGDAASQAASLAEGAINYVDQARGIAQDMSDAQLGPLASKTPDFTANSQLLKMTLNNLIGNVREKLGPGLLSDTDIKLLKSMIPNMAMDKEPLLKSLDLFESELQRIINKKPGNRQQTTKSVKWSDL